MMDKERVHEVLGHIDPDLIEALERPKKQRSNRALRIALIAACLCMAIAGTAYTCYILSAQAAREQIYTMGTFYQVDGIRYEFSEESLDLLENEYTTQIDQTVESGGMSVTLVSTMGFCGERHSQLGILLRLELPDGVEIEESEIYRFYDKLYIRDSSDWYIENWTFIPSGKEGCWYAFCVYDLPYGHGDEMPIGTTIRLELSQLGKKIYDVGKIGRFQTIVSGEWTFTFDLDLKESTQLLDSPISFHDGCAGDGYTKIESLTISPMMIEVYVTRDTDFYNADRYEYGAVWSKEWYEELEKWRYEELTVQLILKDGGVRQFQLEEQRGTYGTPSSIHSSDALEADLYFVSNLPIDWDEVRAIRVGEVTIPVDLAS